MATHVIPFCDREVDSQRPASVVYDLRLMSDVREVEPVHAREDLTSETELPPMFLLKLAAMASDELVDVHAITRRREPFNVGRSKSSIRPPGR